MLQAVFLAITLLCVVFFFYGTGRSKTVALLITGWGTLVAALALSGFFAAAPVRLAPFIVASVVLAIFCFRKLRTAPVHIPALLAVHALRIGVEWVLYELYLQGKIPKLMTFRGWNFDIVAGLTAVVLLAYSLLAGRRLARWIFMAWNIAGLALLTIIVVLALLSAPLPLQQLAFDQPNVALLEAPYCLLPTVIVPVVYLSHALMMRRVNAAARLVR